MKIENKDIVSGSVTIAKFMGQKSRVSSYAGRSDIALIYPLDLSGQEMTPEAAEYHSSFDWLMPVWTKFYNLEDSLHPDYIPDYEWYIGKIKGELLYNNTPHQAFLRLVDAISWYIIIKKGEL